MKGTLIALVCAGVLLAAPAGPALADLNVNVGLGVPVVVPPVYAFPAPAMVVVPGTPVYCAPGLGVDIFFYGGYWWHPYQGGWYRSHSYNGPWAAHQPPSVLVNLPPNYRQVVVKEKPIPYGQWKKMHHGGPSAGPAKGGGPGRGKHKH